MTKQSDLTLKDTGAAAGKGPVICLGMTFESDEERRAWFTEELRKKLKDPEFWAIEGFPIGEYEDILALSDPPYYTACPNPWIADYIKQWETEKPVSSDGNHYHREPFAADVSEGKYHPIYRAHSYHKTVPHRAIMRYILHYTEPGDIVFDGFAGTGMTGVAAQMCGDKNEVMALGYQVKPDGTILQEAFDEKGNKTWQPFSRLGARRAVLNDLSPAATFIAYNYNTPVDIEEFEHEAKRILKEVEEECGWMYETLHTDGKTRGKINYTVWSDVFVCPECTHELVFWKEAVDKEAGKVRKEFPCPQCGTGLTKRQLDRAWTTKFDSAINETIRQAKQVPVLINYSLINSNKKRPPKYEKRPDKEDLELIERIESSDIPYWLPTERMMDGGESRRNDPLGITHAHHFFYKRVLLTLSIFVEKCHLENITRALWVATSVTEGSSKLNRERPFGLPSKLSGTLYISSMIREINIIEFLRRKISRYQSEGRGAYVITGTFSTTQLSIGDEMFDYLFFDPRFGATLSYSELNFLWESWLKVLTNNEHEAIENRKQDKDLSEYRKLMEICFSEAYRVLKPGRWMTVEFSNTKASVWNAIQTALTDAGFIVANVSALDKQQGSFKAVTTPTAVRQDLVISAYKPNGGFEERFLKEAKTEEGVWGFVRTHLSYLPVTKLQEGKMQHIPELDPRILFDQVVAYYVRKFYAVPLSSQEFQAGLPQRFVERNGMYFLPEQIAEYDRNKMISGELGQTALFVSDEASAIQWLRQLLHQKPQTFAELNRQFMQQLSGWSRNEQQLDLRELLEQNFLLYNGKGPVPGQIHAYLSSNWKNLRNRPKDDPELREKAKDRWYVPDPNKAGDLEMLRERALRREYEQYKTAAKRLSVFRLEAVRAGFKKAWQDREYETIIEVAEKIPPKVLEEDPKLLMWYDQAVTRMGVN